MRQERLEVSPNARAYRHGASPRSAVISSRSAPGRVDQVLCVVDMSSTQRLHVRPQGGGAVECDRAEVTSVTSWLRRARCRSRSARSSAALASRRHAGRVWRQPTGHGAPEDPHAPRADTRPSSRPTIDASKGAVRVPGFVPRRLHRLHRGHTPGNASTTEAQPFDGYVEDSPSRTRDKCRSWRARERGVDRCERSFSDRVGHRRTMVRTASGQILLAAHSQSRARRGRSGADAAPDRVEVRPACLRTFPH